MDILLFIVPMLIVFYFLMIRPQRKEKNKKIVMLKNMQIGDEIITYSGIHGKVIKNPEDKESFTMEVSKGVDVLIEKEAVYKNISQIERNKLQPEKLKTKKGNKK